MFRNYWGKPWSFCRSFAALWLHVSIKETLWSRVQITSKEAEEKHVPRWNTYLNLGFAFLTPFCKEFQVLCSWIIMFYSKYLAFTFPWKSWCRIWVNKSCWCQVVRIQSVLHSYLILDWFQYFCVCTACIFYNGITTLTCMFCQKLRRKIFPWGQICLWTH